MSFESILALIQENPATAGVMLGAVAFMRPLFVAIRAALIRRVDRAWDEAPDELDDEAREAHAVSRIASDLKVVPVSLIRPMVHKKTIPPED